MFRILSATTLALSMLAAPAAAQPSDSPIALHEPVGQQVAGSDSAQQAPELGVGLFQDLLERGESARGSDDGSMAYYRLPRPQPGERLALSAQLIVDPMSEPSSDRSIGLSAELVGPGGEACSSTATAHTSRSDIARPALVTLVTERYDPERGWPRAGCVEDPEAQVLLRVVRTGEWQDQHPVPLELRLLREPPIDETTLGEPVTEEMPPQAVQLTGAAGTVSGGTGFATAATLEDRAIVGDSILPFETKYYKVHVAAGQRLNYRVMMGEGREASARGLTVSTYNPLLEKDMTLHAERSLRREKVSSFVTQNLATAVSPDLSEEFGRYRSLSVPGDYYIMISGDAREPRGLTPLPYEIAVELTGEAQSAPEWVSAALQPGEAGESTAGRSAATSWWPGTGQLGAFLGGLAVALAGYALWWLLRRRRQS